MATNLFILPLGKSRLTNQVTVTLKLTAAANYLISSLTSATVVITDWPVNVWRRAQFSATELAAANFCGEATDPDHDGIPNLLEYALGTAPKTAEANPFFQAVTNGIFIVTYPLTKAAPDVALTAEWSTNLLDWLAGPANLQIVSGRIRSPIKSSPSARMSRDQRASSAFG